MINHRTGSTQRLSFCSHKLFSFVLKLFEREGKALFVRAVLCVLSISATASQSLAQVPADQAADQTIQLEQQRNAARQRLLEQERRERTTLPIIPSEFIQSVEPSDTCFDVDAITIEGASQLPSSLQNSLTAPFVGQCINRQSLEQLQQAITTYYFESGYVTSRAYVPQQNLADRVLRIQVIEGELESIQLSEESGTAHVSLSTAFPHLSGGLLNLRDIEQGLEQINRLGSRTATIDLLPGSYPGSSVVNLQTQTRRPFLVRAGLNNSGQRSTGIQQQNLFASWDSPLGLNDYVYLSLQSDTKDTSDNKKSESISGYWDMPLGYWLFSLEASRFEYASIVAGNFSNFETSGLSVRQALSVERIMHRDADSKTRLGLSLNRKKNENFIEDVLLDSSSRTLAVSDLSFQHEQYFRDGGVLVSGINYLKGLRLFGSPDDDESPADSPQAQFSKYSFLLDYQRGFDWFGQAFQWQSMLVGQYSEDTLFGIEQISIGSQYTVRGYRENNLNSHTGGYWRNSLSSTFRPQGLSPWIQSIRSSLSYDVGLIRDEFYGEDKYADLQGWGVGLDLYNDVGSASLTYARPVNAPDYLLTPQEQFYFSINISF
ncbi:ShlB/FhaC/HecB family hemolysin secretion/activation protein [Gammaproteobacteria bacterium]|nr:ShlB/FhaC/HecB family hemolysin secretion/activation protein [Gammaproteobacteria bacterium]